MSRDAGIDRLREAFLSDAGAAESTADCPDPEEIWAASQAELPKERTRDLLNHSLGCPVCKQAWHTAASFIDARPAERTSSVTPGATGRGWAIAGLAAAAVLLGVLVIPRVLGPPAPPADDVFRDETTTTIRSLLPEGEPLDPQNCMLRWSAAGEDLRYEVEVVDTQFRVLLRARDIAEPELRVGPEALDGLASGAELFWRVRGFDAAGKEVATAAFQAVLK